METTRILQEGRQLKSKRVLSNPDVRRLVFNKNDGRCHLCGGRLSISSFHIEHSKSKANGGSDHLNNLWPACRACNLKKSNRYTSGQMRELNGYGKFKRSDDDDNLGLLLGLAAIGALALIVSKNRPTGRDPFQ